jgi:outer membrane protein assembly factor BamB
MQNTQSNGRRFPSWHSTFHFTVVMLTLATVSPARADDWPQWLGPRRDGVWRETGIVAKLPTKDKLKVRWKVPIGGGYAGPAVAGGRVVVMDRLLPPGVKNPANAFGRTPVPGKERVLCLDQKTGNILWQKEYNCRYEISYPAGPRCTPLVAGDKVYTLGAMGDLYCWNVKDGAKVWYHNFIKEYGADPQMWGFAGHPLLEGDLLICLVGGEGSSVVAFQKDSGKEAWKAVETAGTGYAPPMVFDIGGKRELIVWHAQGVNSLDPKIGKVHWSHRWPKSGTAQAHLTVSSPRYDPEHRWLFLTAFYEGSLMLQVNANGTAVKELWKSKVHSEQPDRTDFLHSIMPTPFIKHGHIYGVCSYGEVRCLNGETGERMWFTRQPTSNGKLLRWANAFLIEHGDDFLLFNELGDLILAQLTPKGYQENCRVNLLPPTNTMAGPPGRRVLWSHPAFADRCIFARNDDTIICVSLATEDYR